jgi:hypothetical protein
MEGVLKFLGAILAVLVIAILLAWPTQWLWNNALIEAVEGINHIGFFQALGINLLCGILFRNSSSKSK